MNDSEKAPEAPIQFDRTTEVALGIALTIGGGALAGAGFVGIDSNEAKTPEDAFMSVPVLDRDNFIMTEDLPYLAVLGVGITMAAAGLSKVFRRKR